jgi:hypothetical protein
VSTTSAGSAAGVGSSAAAGRSAGGSGGKYAFYRIGDNFTTLEGVSEGLRNAGLEASQLIVAIDWTKSNQWTGRKSWRGRSLHWLDPSGIERNPYEAVIEIVGKVRQPHRSARRLRTRPPSSSLLAPGAGAL